MLFNSLKFLCFFPLVFLTYYLAPKKVKKSWLILCSYYFYMSWNLKYGLLLFGCTVVTYYAALPLDRSLRKESNKRSDAYILTSALIIILGVLCIYKYLGFVTNNLSKLLNLLNIVVSIPNVDIVMPVGISFFTFQAAGYLIDVYKGKIPSERNFIDYALFISFFPQLLSGPIGRGEKLLPQIKNTPSISYENLRDGVYMLIWGFFLKLVIADRAALLVNNVYGDFRNHTGSQLILATIIYAFQIYCDFYGYSTMALGTAKILGINLMENFESPYLAQSVKEFWRRWHISLSTWFRDYIYFPLGGSRCSRLRIYFNLMVVFLISGLWHGSKWSFVAWGLINGLYQVADSILKPVKERTIKTLGVNVDTFSFRFLKGIVTFTLIDISWIFFRANSFMDALRIGKRMVFSMHPTSIIGDQIYNLGLDEKNFRILIISILILICADIAKYKGIELRKWCMNQNWLARVMIISCSITFILLVGIWGNSYDAASFIYFKF